MPSLGFWVELTIGRRLGVGEGGGSEAPEKGT